MSIIPGMEEKTRQIRMAASTPLAHLSGLCVILGSSLHLPCDDALQGGCYTGDPPDLASRKQGDVSLQIWVLGI